MSYLKQLDYEFNMDLFDLSDPIGIQGGSYLTKLLYESKPLQIVLQECFSKQSIITKNNKKYIDLMFEDNKNLINLFENLEEKITDIIFEKSNLWFHTPLDREDIVSQFTSPLKLYKGGKYTLFRGTIKDDCAIYNNSHEYLNEEHIKNDSVLIPLIEIKGIRFSTKEFKFDIEIKQIMVMPNVDLKKCLIDKVSNINYDESSNNDNNLDKDSNKNVEQLIHENIIHNDDTKEIEDNVTEDNVTEDKEIEDNVTEDNVTEDNVTEDKETGDKETEDNVTEDNVTEDKETDYNVTEDNVLIDINDVVDDSKEKDINYDTDTNNDTDDITNNNLTDNNSDKFIQENNLDKDYNLENILNDINGENVMIEDNNMLWLKIRDECKKARTRAINAYLKKRRIKGTLEGILDVDDESDDDLDYILYEAGME